MMQPLPSMPFLESLVPRDAASAAGNESDVRAALPSRFTPWRDVAPPGEGDDGDESQDAIAVRAPNDEPEEVGQARVDRRALEQPIARAAEPRAAQPPVLAAPHTNRRPTTASETPVVRESPTQGAGRRATPVSPDVRLSAQHGSRERDDGSRPDTVAVPAETLESSVAPRGGPLSEAARAQRAAANGDRSTIVHVTIDRIDVRAPAVADAERARQKKRGGPSQSLSDYLRHRESSGGARGPQ